MFDSHCHLTDDRFADDVDAVIDRARAAGLLGIVTVASDLDDARRALEIAERHDWVWSTAGIHPHVAEHAGDDALDRLRDLLQLDRVVAIGETGLDYHYDNSPRQRQRQLFESHLAIAAETGMPVIVHCRSADDDVAAMIRAFPGIAGVLHCFAGGNALFDAGIEAGWFVSFAGLITFRNYDRADLVAATPADRLLVETDSPYLAPVPHRGRRNEPAFAVETCRAAAVFRSEGTDFTARRITENARRFYRLDT
jgi:TatD DNase family protein